MTQLLEKWQTILLSGIQQSQALPCPHLKTGEKGESAEETRHQREAWLCGAVNL